MGVTIGRLRPDAIFDWRFVALSHNTVRGAAGGAVLTAELLVGRGVHPAEVGPSPGAEKGVTGTRFEVVHGREDEDEHALSATSTSA